MSNFLMRRNSITYIKELLRNKYFIKNFFTLISITILFFGISAIMFDNNSKNILENELLTSNQSTTELMGNSIDSYITDIRYIAASLDTSSTVTTFFSSATPDNIIPNIYQRLQEQLRGYQNSYTSIASIYLYSERSDLIISSNNTVNTAAFADLAWLECFEESPAPYVLYSRAYRDSYPFYLTLLKQIQENGYNSAIVINIDLSKLPILTETGNQEFFIVTDDRQILYREGKRDYLEPLSTVPQLGNFSDSSNTCSSIFVDETGKAYAYTQLHSSKYDWNYVLTSALPSYSEDLAGRRVIWTTILLALFFTVSLLSAIMSLRFFKPIQILTNLLGESAPLLEDSQYPSKEISDLAQKIIYYTQTNRQLSEELSSSLDRLNQAEQVALQSQINPHFLFNTLNIIHIEECKALGYEHPLPELTMKLSSILHHAFDSSSLVQLNKEFDYTRQYIDLMNARNRNSLRINYEIDEDILHALVPKLFMQPIIENIFFHGFPDGMDENSLMTVSIQKITDNQLCVSITDNGVGIPLERYQELMSYIEKEALSQTNIGLKNVIRRMKLVYEEQFSIEIQTKEKEGTRFSLTFPLLLPETNSD